MSIDLEQRLRDYGSTIDAATAADLVQRDAPAIETSFERVDHGPRRAVKLVAVLTLAGVVAIGVLAITHRPRAAVTAPSSTSTSVPAARDCTSRALTLNQRVLCRVRKHKNEPRYSNVGSGTDGLPSPTQEAALAIEKTQYDPAEVQLLLNRARANGNVPTDQALVSVLEFRNACRQLLLATTAAEAAPADRVASVVDPIMNPEIARLTARQPAGSESNQLFASRTRQIDTGHGADVLHDIGRNFCIDVIPPQS